MISEVTTKEAARNDFMLNMYLKVIVISIISTIGCISYAFAGTWTTYTRPSDVEAIACRGNDTWCATNGGLVRWNSRDGTYRVYTTADGLPENQVNGVDAAPDGNIWCGTAHSGVACFDGHEWKTYTVADGLIADIVWDVKASPNGDVWVSAGVWSGDYYTGGLSRFDGKTWVSFPVPDMKDSPVTTLDVGPDGTAWGVDYARIIRCDGHTVDIFTKTDGLGHSPLRGLSVGTDGNLWYGGSDYIGCYRERKWEIYPHDHIGDVYSFYMAADSTIWRGVYNGGIVGMKNGVITRYTTADGLPNNIVVSITADDEGRIWCGTWDGAACFENSIWKPRTFNPLLADELVWSLAQAPDGSVWCGGRAGVTRFDGSTWRTYNQNDGMLRGTVLDIAIDKAGVVWCGIMHRGVSRFDGRGWTNYTETDGLISNDMQCLAVDADGGLWCGTNAGISHFDGARWKNYTTADGLIAPYLDSIICAPDGKVWASQYTLSSEKNSGVSCFDGTSWKSYKKSDGLADYYIRDIATGPDGSIWLASGEENGITRFDGKNWTTFSPPDNLLYGGDVRSIAVEADGTIWCGSYRYGAVRFDGKDWRLFTMRDGLASNEVGQVLIGKDGRIYFGTSNGLTVYNPTVGPVSIKADTPAQFLMLRNHPNPFNPSTTISFTLPAPGRVNLSVYSITGQKVRTLWDGYRTYGTYTIIWDGKDDYGNAVSSGIYIARLQSGKQVVSRKVVLIR
jgi:ligand-binding sensor domain-containing protein